MLGLLARGPASALELAQALILVTDGAMQVGPPEAPAAPAATIFNVESFFGRTLSSRALVDAFSAVSAA